MFNECGERLEAAIAAGERKAALSVVSSLNGDPRKPEPHEGKGELMKRAGRCRALKPVYRPSWNGRTWRRSLMRLSINVLLIIASPQSVSARDLVRGIRGP